MSEKIGVMEMCQVWETGLPISPGSPMTSEDWQQFLNGYPGLPWSEAEGAFILDLNTRLRVYLTGLYGLDYATSDLTSMICRHLDEQTSGDYDQRFLRLIDEATPGSPP